MDNYKTSIIGGSVAGLSVANYLQQRGISSTVYEEHSEIGKPVQCSGLISANALNHLKRIADIDSLNRINKAEFRFEGIDKTVTIDSKDTRAFVIDRADMDRSLAKAFEANGGKIVTGTRAGREEFNSSTIIGADGFSSQVAKHFGFPPLKRYAKTLQYVMNANSEDTSKVIVFFSKKLFPGFFGWSIPIDEYKVKIGCGAMTHNNVDLRESIKHIAKIIGSESTAIKPIEINSGIIPLEVRKQTAKTLNDRKIFLVGDSAGHVKPLSGGGIYFANRCAEICSQNIDDTSAYEHKWRQEFLPDLKTYNLAKKAMDFLPYSLLFQTVKLFKVEEYLYHRGEMDRLSKSIRGEYIAEHIKKLIIG